MNDNMMYEKVKFKDVNKYLQRKLVELNQMPSVPLNVILFKEAVITLCYISRIITLPKEHLIIVGIGKIGFSANVIVQFVFYCILFYDFFKMIIRR